MALGVTDLKKGTIFQMDGTPYRVVEYAQKVMGRGGSIVNVKVKSLVDGKILAKTFKGNESIQPADVNNHNAQYLYSDDKTFYFMNTKSYETLEVAREIIAEQSAYLLEGMEVIAQTFNGQVIAVDMPKNVYLKVTETENAVKGDTSSSITKDARLETGVRIKVPAFIKTDDIISVDTTTGDYRERKK